MRIHLKKLFFNIPVTSTYVIRYGGFTLHSLKILRLANNIDIIQFGRGRE